MQLSEHDLSTLENLVNNRAEWSLLKRVFQASIDRFWYDLKHTDIADDKRVAANHKLAVGVEASLNDMVKEMEEAVYRFTHPTPEVIDDITKELTQQ